jgi:hypothetical protein
MTETPLSWRALETVHDQFFEMAAQICKREPHRPMLLAVIADESGIQRSEIFPPDIIGKFFKDESGKQAFSRLLLALFTDTSIRWATAARMGAEPTLYVQITEAWFVRRTKEEMEHYRGGASDQPDRRESLCIVLHTAAGSIMCNHEIVNEPTRHVERAPFPSPDCLDDGTYGRFTVQSVMTSPPER